LQSLDLWKQARLWRRLAQGSALPEMRRSLGVSLWQTKAKTNQPLNRVFDLIEGVSLHEKVVGNLQLVVRQTHRA
jgi:hypothetical protein